MYKTQLSKCVNRLMKAYRFDIKVSLIIVVGYRYSNKYYVINEIFFPYISWKWSAAFYYSTLLFSPSVSFITYSTSSSSPSGFMLFTLLLYSHTYNYYYCTGGNIPLICTTRSTNFIRNFRVTHSWKCNLLFFISIIEE